MRRLFTIIILGFWVVSNAQVSNLQLTQLLNRVGFNDLKTEEISINSSHTDKKTGITHIYFKQMVNGVEVFNSQSSVHIDKNGNLVKQNIAVKATNLVENSKKIGANEALNIALNTASIVKKALNKVTLTDNIAFKIEDKGLSSEAIVGKPIYYEKNGSIVAAWQVDVLNDETADWLNIIIDAKTGLVIEKNNYTTKCSAENITSSNLNKPYFFEFDNNNLGKAANTGTYKVYPIPMESPARGDRQLISNANDLKASPFGWHDTDAVEGAEFTITRGNNVWAKEDTLANNSTTTAYSPNGGTDLLFDFPYGLDAGPRTNLNAAITNLFFWNNTMHDVFYHYGFDEESGNFQSKNYTNLGLGKDYVYAEAQDGSGTDNANFAVPVDGTNPRMQMYLWGGTASSATNILQVNEPSSIANKYAAIAASFGPRLSVYPITAKMVLVNDGTTNSNGNLGCASLVNADSVKGNIAVITRGGTGCTYQTKVLFAQEAGAVGVVMINTSNTVTAMTGAGTGINIPSVMISSANGTIFKNAIATENVEISMYDSSIFNAANRTYDSDFDNGVIAHEYGHGISIRLTGGAANSSCLSNQEQAGEGWSDFFGLALTSKPYETTLIGRGIGTHLIGQDTLGIGIRPYKYSRNMAVNPVNYNNIKTLSVPHGVGFVWCSALYDIYLDMIDKYGFDENVYTGKGGNNKTIELVVMGLKLQPCNPGFMDSRDALILADSLLNGGANKLLLWKAFARRGMGADAKQGLSSSRTDGTAGFKLPSELSVSNNEMINSNSIEVFPNPNKGNFTVNSSFDLTDCTYQLSDINGKKISFILNKTNDNEMKFDISNLDAGVYFLSVKSNNGLITKKVIVY